MLGNTFADFLSNLTTAESAFLELKGRLTGSASALDDLQVDVAFLERSLRLELRQLLEEARLLTQNLTLLVRAIVYYCIGIEGSGYRGIRVECPPTYGRDYNVFLQAIWDLGPHM